ncbi:lipopolysaccharide biosynthesis protein [Streptococcus uberis]|uniref:lipopolysaccharide biosynthesis protein n=1 Tax=Streptococcus uberis TaxID=1349 RepID=UPI001FF3DE89|nr:polysaccharide biosynthesis C-terminal domain-containing protein [Streptococcus uberis]
MNRKKELFKNTIIIGIGNIFTKAISFLLVPLFTIWLTPSQYGEYDLLFSYVSLVVPVLTLQLEQAVLRYTLDNKDKGDTYFKTSIVFVLVNSLVFSLIFGTLLDFQYHLSFTFCTIMFVMQVCTTEYLRGRNELKTYSLANILCGIATILFSFLFVYVLKLGVDGLLIAFGLAYLFTSLSIIISKKLYKNYNTSTIDLSILKILLMYSLPLLPNAISWWITNVSDRTLIKIFLGSEMNGIYAVSTKIPTLIAVFYSIFNLAWQQSAITSAKDDFEKRREFYHSTFRQLFLFLFSSAICIIALSPFLYRYFLEKEYFSGLYIVPILILATVFLNFAQYFGGILLGNMDSKTNGLTTVVGAVINIILNLLLINYIGISAAAISTMISYIIMFVMRLLKLKDLFDVKKIFRYAVLGVAIVTGISFVILMGNLHIQLIMLVLSIIIFLVSNQKIMLSVLNNLRGRRV